MKPQLRCLKKKRGETMYGAIIGDIVGSTFEFRSTKRKDFPFFARHSDYTDDTVMTVAVANAMLAWKQEGGSQEDYMVREMRKLGRKYPSPAGDYGPKFKRWLITPWPRPYRSCGNGSAMRASACGLLANTLEEALSFAYSSAVVTHNHPEGIKGAQATAAAIFLAKNGSSKEDIREYIETHFYRLDRTWKEIQKEYSFDATCQGTVPEAIISFLESANYEDAIRNAIALGGDADTLAAICGSIAWAYYRKCNDGRLTNAMKIWVENAEEYIPKEFRRTVDQVEKLAWGDVLVKEVPEESNKLQGDIYAEVEIKEQFPLERFIIAHNKDYERALQEIAAGKKTGHWMWYIFPQIRGFGYSSKAKYYAIQDREEAVRYWENSMLSSHLTEICKELLKQEKRIDEILCFTDRLKLRSCMTLFYAISRESIFKEVLDKFYDSQMDDLTLQKISGNPVDSE